MSTPEAALVSAVTRQPNPCPQQQDRRPLDRTDSPSPDLARLLRNHQPDAPASSTFQSSI